MSRYNGSDTYVYPGTKVLRNKADLCNQSRIYEVMIASFSANEKPLADLLANALPGAAERAR